MPKRPKPQIPKAPKPMTEEERLKIIANVCMTLRKRADYFLNSEPENLTIEDFDKVAEELEILARDVDSLLDQPEDE